MNLYVQILLKLYPLSTSEKYSVKIWRPVAPLCAVAGVIDGEGEGEAVRVPI